jgi:hypothetical protein
MNKEPVAIEYRQRILAILTREYEGRKKIGYEDRL